MRRQSLSYSGDVQIWRCEWDFHGSHQFNQAWGRKNQLTQPTNVHAFFHLTQWGQWTFRSFWPERCSWTLLGHHLFCFDILGVACEQKRPSKKKSKVSIWPNLPSTDMFRGQVVRCLMFCDGFGGCQHGSTVSSTRSFRPWFHKPSLPVEALIPLVGFEILHPTREHGQTICWFLLTNRFHNLHLVEKSPEDWEVHFCSMKSQSQTWTSWWSQSIWHFSQVGTIMQDSIEEAW